MKDTEDEGPHLKSKAGSKCWPMLATSTHTNTLNLLASLKQQIEIKQHHITKSKLGQNTAAMSCALIFVWMCDI